jgi:tRNA threonylcarbamoyladenosine biosynthesis protein TsaE
MKHFESNSAEDTYNIGKELGEKAEAGQVFALDGDLGTGKTVFTKGFAEGLGIKEPVNSPTFTILQIYEDGRLPLYHFDVYRIEEPEEMDEVGFDDYIYGSGVCMIEWADQIREILPEKTRTITIRKDLSKGTDYRDITITDGMEREE